MGRGIRSEGWEWRGYGAGEVEGVGVGVGIEGVRGVEGWGGEV